MIRVCRAKHWQRLPIDDRILWACNWYPWAGCPSDCLASVELSGISAAYVCPHWTHNECTAIGCNNIISAVAAHWYAPCSRFSTGLTYKFSMARLPPARALHRCWMCSTLVAFPTRKTMKNETFNGDYACATVVGAQPVAGVRGRGRETEVEARAVPPLMCHWLQLKDI